MCIGARTGLNRSMPLAYGVALVSSLSMAGVPPMLGFPAKEAAVEAALGLSGGEGGGGVGGYGGESCGEREAATRDLLVLGVFTASKRVRIAA